jgi:predicted nuclease with TOPRIM domain
MQSDLDSERLNFETESRLAKEGYLKETMHVQTENTQLRRMVQSAMNEKDALQREVEALRSKVVEGTGRLVNLEAELNVLQNKHGVCIPSIHQNFRS